MQNQRVLFLTLLIHESNLVPFRVFNVNLVRGQRRRLILIIHEIRVPFEPEIEETFSPNLSQQRLAKHPRQLLDKLLVFVVEVLREAYGYFKVVF